MPHGFLEVTLPTTQHEVILHGFPEVTSECQILLHDLASLYHMGLIGRIYVGDTRLLHTKYISCGPQAFRDL